MSYENFGRAATEDGLGYKTDWLFRQAVGAVRCLFDFVEVPWGREKTGSRIMPVSLAITHCIYYKKRMQN